VREARIINEDSCSQLSPSLLHCTRRYTAVGVSFSPPSIGLTLDGSHAKSRLGLFVVVATAFAAIPMSAAGAAAYVARSAATSDVSASLHNEPSRRANTSPFVVAAVGDIACSPRNVNFNDGNGRNGDCKHAAVSRLIQRRSPDQILVLGDAQYDDGRYLEYRRSYDRSWGTLLGITRPVPGNHDYHTSSAKGYLHYFAEQARPRGKTYYSFRAGGWLLIGLNSNCNFNVGCTSVSRQNNWLRERLATSPRCTLAFMHHARFSSGPHGNERLVAPLWKSLYEQHADVIVAGHDHTYERFARLSPSGSRSRSGIRSFVSGLGGAEAYAFSSRISSGSKYRYNDGYGVLFLALQRDEYRWKFVTVGGSVKDHGAAPCR
jgi:hypothetical protein